MLYKLIVWIYHYIMGTKPEPEKPDQSEIDNTAGKIVDDTPAEKPGLERKEA